jgi:hypothetical protein
MEAPNLFVKKIIFQVTVKWAGIIENKMNYV